MSRKAEKVVASIGAFWNILNGLITLFFYSSWVRTSIFANMDKNTKGLNYLSENLHSFAIIYGFAFILLGCINLYLIFYQIKDGLPQKKIPLYFIIAGAIEYIMVDAVGAIAYLIAGIMMFAKNKAIRKSLRKGVA